MKDQGVWKVGNGKSIRIFGDSWIPGRPNMQLNQLNVEVRLGAMMVDQLISKYARR